MDREQAELARREYEALRPTYSDLADGLRVLISQLCASEKISIDAVTARAKDPASVVDKLKRRARYTSLDDLTDKVGVRVISRYQSDVPSIVRLLASEFKVVETVRHGGDSPNSFGYMSQHLIICVSESRIQLREWTRFEGINAEVQVRSILQHAWASISHSLDYKTEVEVPETARRSLFRVAAMLETADEIFDTYRGQVEEVRADYQTDVADENWRHLAVNLDSVSAAWLSLPVERLTTAAIAAGFRASGYSLADELNPDDNYRDMEISTLVRVAVAAGINSIGKLADVMTAVSDRGSLLQRIVHETQDSDMGPPVAVAPDVAALALVADNAEDRRVIEAALFDLRTELVEGAQRAGEIKE